MEKLKGKEKEREREREYLEDLTTDARIII